MLYSLGKLVRILLLLLLFVDHDWASGTHGIPVPSRLHTGT
jgi:hypothetical protein